MEGYQWGAGEGRMGEKVQGITYFAHEDKLLSGTSGGCKLFNISQGGKEAEDKPLKVGKRQGKVRIV